MLLPSVLLNQFLNQLLKILFFWNFLLSEWDLLPFFFTFSNLFCLMFLNAQYLLPLQCHGAGICSVDPSCCCLYCCWSAWHLWSSACLRLTDVSRCSSAGQVHHHPCWLKGFLAPKSFSSPHINLRCQRRSISDTLSQTLRYPHGKERPWRNWRTGTTTCTSSPICFLKVEPYL